MSCTNRRHILEIEELSLSFSQYENERSSRKIELPVISKLSVSVHEGEIVAVVGSSGSGKSLLAHAILGLLPYNAKVTGNMYYDGELLTEEHICALRGNKIAFVPQSTTYLDPLMTVGKQVQGGKGEEKKRKQRGLFKRYGLGEEVDTKYPFECSGGMTRRVLLTSALMGDPELIIADEPTPGMDLALAKKSMEDFRNFADEGKECFSSPMILNWHLRWQTGLLCFMREQQWKKRLYLILLQKKLFVTPIQKLCGECFLKNGFQPLPGVQPYVKDMPKGCPFGPRCSMYTEACQGEIPMQRVGCGTVRCVRFSGEPLAVEQHHHERTGGKA